MAPTLYDDDAKPGDLIEIDRGYFKHWAIYVGRNEVVHLIPSTNDLGPLANLGILADSSSAKVRCQTLWKVVRSDSYQINNSLDREYQPLERHIIVREARRLVGRVLPYCVATYNCEHFATELRYGKPESRQVQTAAVIGGVAVASIGILALGAALFSMLGEEDEKKHRGRRH